MSESLMTRRRAFAVAGAGAAGALVAARMSVRTAVADAASCASLTPVKTIGPYFVEEKLNRSDITVDPSTGAVTTGVPLTLVLALLNEDNGCAALAGAMVDIWHADPGGKYSDESSEGTSGKKNLRGYQLSDSSGKVTFKTVYPGWYSGRAVHIHIRIRQFDASGNATYDFTSQLFFDDTLTDTVYKRSPYSTRGSRDTRNAADNIYGSDGSTLIPAMTGDASSGFTGTFTFGLSSSTQASSSGGGMGTPGSAPTRTTTTGTTTTTTGAGSTTTTTGTTTTSSGSTAAGSVGASLGSVKWTRSKAGTRKLALKIKTTETTTLTVRLLRGSKVLKHKTFTSVPSGTHTANFALAATLAGGRATIDVRASDGTNVKHLTKITHVPSKEA